MKFSIIIPTLNAEEKLHITLDSLAGQLYKNYECIIMDGISSDATAEIIKNYQKRLPALFFYSETDRGIYDAMNKGVLRATGEYILFLGAGDSLYDNNVLENLRLHLSHNSCDILYGDICFLPNQITKQTDTLTNHYFRSGKMICHQSVIVAKHTLTDYPFRTKFSFGADRDWLIHHYRNGARFEHIPLTIANYDTEGYTGNPENAKAVWMESGRILKQYYGSFMVPVTILKYYLIIKWRLLWQSFKRSAEK